MASNYFTLIGKKLDTFYSYDANSHEDRAKFRRWYTGVDILEMFCMCLEEAWDYNTADESLRCMINHLKLIWVQEEEDNNLETWPKHIQHFHPLTFGLEGKIEQSKPQIEQWCQILVNSSWMQCKSSAENNIKPLINFVQSILKNLGNLPVYYYRASKTVPFFNQIVILKDMLRFLNNSLFPVDGCTDSKELVEYVNFIHAFLNNAACLTCLYWAKESNDETKTQMNTVFFYMLQKIKPCAADVIACYFAVLKSSNLLQSDVFISQGVTHAGFVGFFFEHTVLEDDFLILREKLIVLFTFLTDTPHENTEEEEEEICSQIYALFREDAYLLLHINEMKQDLSNKNMLLSDFKIKIDILNAQIIQLYNRRRLDSWNMLEAEKMSNTYFASVQRELSAYGQSPWFVQVPAQVHLYLMEIRFLRSFFQCFETWDDSDEETRVRLHSVVTSLQRIWGQENDMGLLSGRLYAIRKGARVDCEHLLDLELKEKFQMSKQEIYAWLISLSHCSFHCTPSTRNKTLKFLDSILDNMSDLDTSPACKDVTFKKQIEILEEKLLLLKNLLELATNCADSKNLKEFNMLVQVFANNAACLIYMCWEKEPNDEIPAETNFMLSNMLQNIKPDTPDVARTYIGTFKAICLQLCDSFLLEQAATSFVDYFFEDLVTPWKNDFQILRDEVIFHLTFVHHHHTGNVEEIIASQLDVIFTDGVYDLLPFDDMKGNFSKKKVGLSDFMMNINGIENAKIRQFCCKFPDSFVYNFPMIIGQGFLDCLIQKLRKLTERMVSDQNFAPFVKNKIMTIEKELVYLTPIFNQILELKDINDAWLEVVNVVYLAEHVISLCFIFYHLICHYIPHLSDVVERIKVVRTKLEKIEECNMSNARCLPHSVGFISTLSQQDQTSEIHEEVVGFEIEEKIIIDNITRGTKSLDIVSIVGMGGLGKTTLAKKVYGSSLVKSHFNIFAFTYVSQDHDKRRLLLDILRDIVGIDDKNSHMTQDDLSHKLKKCLSRRKYFIVLDDIWNINAWDEVRSSFPDNQNGSRVMFTTRSLEVAERGKIQCTPHRLRCLTNDESWKLFQKKAFHNGMPPPNLSDVAKLVVKKCNGLPIAIVIIAGLLARTKTSLWIEISKKVSSYLFNEGCMDIFEISYKHLPEYLKPCLLYLGAFPEHRSHKVRQVTLLWIAEGFIKESKTKSLYDVAKEYLYELVNRSLIIVDKVTIGEIRTFRVHDLIHDFCQKKCLDKNFFQLGHGTTSSSFSAPLKYNQYRVSVQKLYEPSLTNTRSLLCFESRFNYYQRIFPLRKFRFAQVLYLPGIWLPESDFAHLTSLIDLRHIEVRVGWDQSIPASISNLWNIQSLILRNAYRDCSIYLPGTLWRMKSLRHVKVDGIRFGVSDGSELDAYPQLDKVVSFSEPHLFGGKDVEWLLQRLPVVRQLNCILHIEPPDSTIELVETFNFHRKLESLKLQIKIHGRNCSYLINFPSTLIKLTLEKFDLSSAVISSIAELQYLRILKLRYVKFPGPKWEMEDVTFPNLKYFELRGDTLKLWTANTGSFPCLEHLFFSDDTLLEELPQCFGEISSLKKITIWSSPKLKSSALWVQEEQMDLGNKVEFVGNIFK